MKLMAQALETLAVTLAVSNSSTKARRASNIRQ